MGSFFSKFFQTSLTQQFLTACESNRVDQVRHFLEKAGEKREQQNGSLNRSLSADNRTAIAEAKFYMECKDSQGLDGLMIASRFGAVQVVEFLLERYSHGPLGIGCSLAVCPPIMTRRSTKSFSTALHFAADNNSFINSGACVSILAKLIEYGSDPTLRNGKGLTALDVARLTGNLQAVRYLDNVMSSFKGVCDFEASTGFQQGLGSVFGDILKDTVKRAVGGTWKSKWVVITKLNGSSNSVVGPIIRCPNCNAKLILSETVAESIRRRFHQPSSSNSSTSTFDENSNAARVNCGNCRQLLQIPRQTSSLWEISIYTSQGFAEPERVYTFDNARAVLEKDGKTICVTIFTDPDHNPVRFSSKHKRKSKHMSKKHSNSSCSPHSGRSRSRKRKTLRFCCENRNATRQFLLAINGPWKNLPQTIDLDFGNVQYNSSELNNVNHGETGSGMPLRNEIPVARVWSADSFPQNVQTNRGNNRNNRNNDLRSTSANSRENFVDATTEWQCTKCTFINKIPSNASLPYSCEICFSNEMSPNFVTNSQPVFDALERPSATVGVDLDDIPPSDFDDHDEVSIENSSYDNMVPRAIPLSDQDNYVMRAQIVPPPPPRNAYNEEMRNESPNEKRNLARNDDPFGDSTSRPSSVSDFSTSTSPIMSSNSTNEDIDAFMCPITNDMMVHPVICVGDGHTYEKDAIEDWFRTHDTSPMTGNELETKQLVPNVTLKKAIDEFQQRNQNANRSRGIQQHSSSSSSSSSLTPTMPPGTVNRVRHGEIPSTGSSNDTDDDDIEVL